MCLTGTSTLSDKPYLKWFVARCCEGTSLYRGVEQRQLAWPIPKRSRVRVPSPPPDAYAPSVRKVARLRTHPQTYGERGSRLASAETTTGAGLIPESPFQSIAREGIGRAVAPSDESGGAFSCCVSQPEAEIRHDNPERVKLSAYGGNRPKIGLELTEKFLRFPETFLMLCAILYLTGRGKAPTKTKGAQDDQGRGNREGQEP